LPHSWRVADYLIETEFARALLSEKLQFLSQRASFDAVADCDLELLEFDRLSDEIVRASAKRGNRIFHQHVGGNHDDHSFGLTPFDLTWRVESRAVGKIDIQEHRGWLFNVEDG